MRLNCGHKIVFQAAASYGHFRHCRDDVMKSKMVACGKIKNKNRLYENLVMSETEMRFPCFPTEFAGIRRYS